MHILDGDPSGGGGHRAGTGRPAKTEFPAWPDDDVIAAIEEVANSRSSVWIMQPHGRYKVDGWARGIAIRVIVDRDGRSIWTAYPQSPAR